MDRPIHPERVRKRRLKIAKSVCLSVLIAGTALAWGFDALRPSVASNRILTAVVERGDVADVITASGVIFPEQERVLTSPATTTVEKVLKKLGMTVNRGDSLLILDSGSSSLKRMRLIEQIHLKQKEKERIAVDLDIELNDLESQYKSKRLRLEATEQQHEQNKKMFDLGGNSRSQFKESEMEVEIARIEVDRIQRSIENTRKKSVKHIESLDLEIDILENELREVENTLHFSRTLVERNGVLTWIVQDEGSTVNQGQIIARIADMNSFAVKATVSEYHAARIVPGLPAIILITDGTRLFGTISTIFPTIEDGIVTFIVSIGEKNNPRLRSNLRADVNIVTAEKHGVLRIKKGQFADGSGRKEVFVIHGGKAVKREVNLGLSGFEWYEVVDGLSEGEKVIISDMRDKMYARELRIR